VQYLYHKNSGVEYLKLKGDEHRYIFKVRRHQEGEVVTLRNLKDNNIYYYKVVSSNRKEADLILESKEELIVEAKRRLHIGWCMIEPKNIERTLPTLNEIGVSSITFIYCKRSQRVFRLDFRRLKKILLNSSQQCGRSKLMELNLIDSLEEFIEKYPYAKGLHFSDKKVTNPQNIEDIVVGCEGGFTDSELKLFTDIVGFDTALILKSQSAVSALASKILI